MSMHMLRVTCERCVEGLGVAFHPVCIFDSSRKLNVPQPALVIAHSRSAKYAPESSK